ncbi:NAD(P)-binding protein [Aspergillus fijiensis CBS 313.89]|uniref:NAD(P)-binding protein n=1 Tax=Aspergillus fijiensis CBS 313.89 TaxID=1448319 RepID=A0A8G1RT69_9EURO|nr:NAD(P)-binding protein [Aspergillus fijiensis CBS 313.89]RAK78434.1 NAD(P)-binding protein [Aspergillus fijiensis CBS 313.89]
MARQLLSEGHDIYVTSRDVARLKELQTMGAHTFNLDVTSSKSIKALSDSITALDVLINNAGCLPSGRLREATIEEVEMCFRTNAFSAITMTNAFLPQLRASKGIVVNHGSITADLPLLGFGVYSASKAALAALNDILRHELAPLGIRVVYLRSGFISTPLLATTESNQVGATPLSSSYQHFIKKAIDRGVFAKKVVRKLLENRARPPTQIACGYLCFIAPLVRWMEPWRGAFDRLYQKLAGVPQLSG